MKSVGSRLAFGVVAGAGLWALAALLPVAAHAADEGGKAAFLAVRCDMCHSVSTAGIEATTKSESMRGPDLVDLAKSRDAQWLVKYLQREIQLDGKDHKKEFKGSDEELQAIVDWLLEQKTD